jgi:chromosome partitioning protein
MSVGITARVVAIANQKGGVGKTTTAVNVSTWLALDGAPVLLVDLDPQANATTGVGIDGRSVKASVYDVLIEQTAVDDAIVETAVERLWCLPSSIDLAGAEIELVPAMSRELRLRRALAPILDRFEYVMIDCPPSLGLLTVNALAAAGEVVVPIQCEYYALDGLGQLLHNINLIKANLNPGLRFSGIVLTMYDPRTRLAEEVVREVRGHFSGLVYSTIVPRSVRLSEAPSFGQPIALYDPRSKGSDAYHAVAREMASDGAGQRARAGTTGVVPAPGAEEAPRPVPADRADAGVDDRADAGVDDRADAGVEGVAGDHDHREMQGGAG